MQHVVLWEEHIIPDQLDGFGINDGQVFAHYHIIGQVLVDKLPKGPPLVSIEHDEEVVAFGDQIM